MLAKRCGALPRRQLRDKERGLLSPIGVLYITALPSRWRGRRWLPFLLERFGIIRCTFRNRVLCRLTRLFWHADFPSVAQSQSGDRSQVLPVGDLIPKLICGFGIINHRHGSITHNQLKYHAGRSEFEAELADCHRKITQRRSLQHAFLYLPLQF